MAEKRLTIGIFFLQDKGKISELGFMRLKDLWDAETPDVNESYKSHNPIYPGSDYYRLIISLNFTV
jgi:hypothetical protein